MAGSPSEFVLQAQELIARRLPDKKRQHVEGLRQKAWQRLAEEIRKLNASPRLIERINNGLEKALILVSAPAGYGKTTLVTEWLHNVTHPVAWLSLDEQDNDPARFLAYLISALQTIAPNFGAGLLVMLRSPQPPPRHDRAPRSGPRTVRRPRRGCAPIPREREPPDAPGDRDRRLPAGGG